MTQTFKPQTDAAINAVFQLTHLSIAHIERLSELGLNNIKHQAEQAQAQLAGALEAKDPTVAIELLKSNLEASASSLADFALTAYELSQQFHEQASELTDEHVDHALTSANKAFQEQIKHAPTGSEIYIGALKSAVEASHKAIQHARTQVKKNIEVANEGVNKLKAHAPQATKVASRRKSK